MTESVLNLYKKEGETPLACLERFRAENLEYKDIPLSYVGRLDPMASGVLLAVAGEENKNRETYIALPKEYECEILFGFGTDSYDALGKIMTALDKFPDTYVLQTFVEKSISSFVGTYSQKYPPFSSKPVDGKPLFAHAREGTMNQKDMPEHVVTVSNIEILAPSTSLRTGWKFMTAFDLENSIRGRIKNVVGDFRQDQILERWSEVLSRASEKTFPILTVRISCGSGFYVRVFAEELGKKVGVPALALSIVRTKVGEYRIKEK